MCLLFTNCSLFSSSHFYSKNFKCELCKNRTFLLGKPLKQSFHLFAHDLSISHTEPELLNWNWCCHKNDFAFFFYLRKMLCISASLFNTNSLLWKMSHMAYFFCSSPFCSICCPSHTLLWSFCQRLCRFRFNTRTCFASLSFWHHRGWWFAPMALTFELNYVSST